ncbi:hypothetical protein EJ08DRAFT_161794 [Tothia fuscella]|uniref:Uncharacterized protein n=1 Tax=Tothia fuscella TaxID=1048955 RepID=A0A9P4NTS3_9PEZI|nr:hypothetical protein EJ08DRAFT_161794 [Tothia fuscella]
MEETTAKGVNKHSPPSTESLVSSEYTTASNRIETVSLQLCHFPGEDSRLNAHLNLDALSNSAQNRLNQVASALEELAARLRMVHDLSKAFQDSKTGTTETTMHHTEDHASSPRASASLRGSINSVTSVSGDTVSLSPSSSRTASLQIHESGNHADSDSAREVRVSVYSMQQSSLLMPQIDGGTGAVVALSGSELVEIEEMIEESLSELEREAETDKQCLASLDFHTVKGVSARSRSTRNLHDMLSVHQSLEIQAPASKENLFSRYQPTAPKVLIERSSSETEDGTVSYATADSTRSVATAPSSSTAISEIALHDSQVVAVDNHEPAPGNDRYTGPSTETAENLRHKGFLHRAAKPLSELLKIQHHGNLEITEPEARRKKTRFDTARVREKIRTLIRHHRLENGEADRDTIKEGLMAISLTAIDEDDLVLDLQT